MRASELFAPAGFAPRPQPANRLGQRILQHPDVARIADEVEARLMQGEALLDVRHQAAERLAVLARGRDHAVDRLRELRIVELAGDAERDAQIEMADP